MDASRRASRSILFLALVIALPACGGDGPTAPNFQSLALVAQTADIDFYSSSGDFVDTDWQQSAHDWLEATLGVSLPSKLQYRKYANRAMMSSMTGSSGNAWADPDVPAVHTIWSRDMHETVHVLSARIGRPTDFFNEGLAVALSVDPVAGDFTPRWNRAPIHVVARGFHARGEIPPIVDWVESGDFRSYSDAMTYPCSGSFMRFLVDTRGLQSVLDLFAGASRDDPRSVVRDRFAATMGVSLGTAEIEWHRFLEGA